MLAIYASVCHLYVIFPKKIHVFFKGTDLFNRACKFSGQAVNYLVSVPSFQECHSACASDQRCCHYSYHRSHEGHPDHTHCFLYSSGECDINSLMFSDPHSHWRTGWRARCQKRFYYNKILFDGFIGSEFVG